MLTLLFSRAALADGTLFNKGPQSANGTEFGASVDGMPMLTA